jgi:hypothetical protein
MSDTVRVAADPQTTYTGTSSAPRIRPDVACWDHAAAWVGPSASGGALDDLGGGAVVPLVGPVDLLPFVVLVVSMFSGRDELSGVQIIALFVFMAGAISVNLLINRIVRRLGRPRSAVSYWLLRNRVGFALWPLRAVPHAIRLARRRGDELW